MTPIEKIGAKGSFTATLRVRLEKALGYTPCPTCGHIEHRSVRADAVRVGIAPSNLFRFLKGKAPSAEVIDQIVAFLEVSR